MNMAKAPVIAAGVPARTADRVDFPMSPLVLPGLARVGDLVCIALAAAVTGFLTDGHSIDISRRVACAVFIVFVYIFLAERAQLHAITSIMRPVRRADDILLAVGTSFMLFLSVLMGFDAWDGFSSGWVLTFALLSGGGVMAWRIGLYALVRMLSTRRIVGQSLVVLGAGEQGRRFLDRLAKAKPFFIEVVGVYHCDETAPPAEVCGHPVLGGVDDLFAAARESKIDEIVVAMPWNADRQLAETVERLKELPVSVHLATDLIGFELAFRPALGAFTALPLFEVVQRPISGWSSALKAIEDYVIAGCLVILLAPVLLTVAAAVRLDSPGPVLFRQRRLGFNNREFNIFKFRSMYHQGRGAPPASAPVQQARRGDPRVTRVGRIIRATSLDELPQLFNVLNGTMSLVGPRPHAISHNHEYGSQIRGYFARHKVKPGITGWAQVKGLRGETETLDKMEARIQHDVYYAENWSIAFDLRILIMTALVVLFQRAAY